MKDTTFPKTARQPMQGVAGFILNDAMEVVEFIGHTGPYLEITPGGVSLHLKTLLRPGLFPEVESALAEARSRGAAATRSELVFVSGERVRRTRLTVSPAPGRSARTECWQLLFEELAIRTEDRVGSADDQNVDHGTSEAGTEPNWLQEESTVLRKKFEKEIAEQEEKYTALLRQLRTQTEQHETATAELETTNAELEAANAELQVTASEREVAQKEAEGKEREFRLLAENVPELFSFVGPDQCYRFVNKRYEEFFGVSREQIVGKHVLDLLGEQAFETARSHIESALAGRRVSFEHLVTTQRFGPRWVNVLYVPDIRADGRARGFFVLATDISERKEAERELQRENAFRLAILDTIDALVVVLDTQGRIVTFNRACEISTGYSFEEVAGREVWQLLDAEERVPVREVFTHLLAGNPNHYTNHVRTKDGGSRLVSWSNTFLTNDKGAVEFVLATGIDITEHSEIQEALRHSEAQASALLETAAQAVLAVDMAGRIGLVNQTAERMFGYSRSELLGRKIELLIPDRFRKQHIEHRTEYIAHPRNRPMGAGMELYGKRKDGAEFPIEVSLSFIEPRDGLTSVAFISDITDRKRTEEELRTNREQLRALTARLLTAHEEERRVIARNLHDDLTQKVAILAMEIGLLAREMPNKISEPRRKMESLAQRVRGLSDDIRRLSHQMHPSVLEHAGLEAALRGYCREFAERHHVRADVKAKQMPEALPQNVATSLYYIAQEALQNVSKHSGADNVQVHLTFEDDLLQLVIIDNGIGFDEAQVRGGERLGLVSMEERARLIGGTLEIQSVPNEGTRVRVSVPLQST